LIFHDVAVDGKHPILHGIKTRLQRWKAHGQLLGVLRVPLDIPAIHPLSCSVPDGQLAEVGFESLSKPELDLGRGGGEHRPTPGNRLDKPRMGPGARGNAQPQTEATDPTCSRAMREPSLSIPASLIIDLEPVSRSGHVHGAGVLHGATGLCVHADVDVDDREGLDHRIGHTMLFEVD
jgi:hypothetical protein